MKTVDRYEGCLPEIADALRAGLVCQEVWVWDANVELASKRTIVDYYTETSHPYIARGYCYTNASLTDPRIPAKPAWTYPDAGPDTPIDTPVWGLLGYDTWHPCYFDGKGGAFANGGTSFSANEKDRIPVGKWGWKKLVLADPDNLRVPPPQDR